MKVVVLGAGLVGGPMAIDLAKDEKFEITVADISQQTLKQLNGANSRIETVRTDLSDTGAVNALVVDHDLVLSAVPGFMGFHTLQAVIEAGRNVVDIAFFPENPFDLDSLAKENNVTAIVDCGVAPGMSGVLIGHVDQLLDRIEKVLIYVGGLPEVREWPFEYKAVFSPIDVIEEYTRPARYVENGQLVVREALSDPELMDFPGIGTLEAFNSDGLRTLVDTIDAPNMKKKTLRYQGHIEKMAVMRETGMFSKQPIEINGTKIRPIDFTAKLLFPKWKREPGEVDITVMQVIIEGEKSGKGFRHVYDLLDRYDPVTETHSMARATGYPATMAVRMLAAGLYDQKGISPPEFVGKKRRPSPSCCRAWKNAVWFSDVRSKSCRSLRCDCLPCAQKLFENTPFCGKREILYGFSPGGESCKASYSIPSFKSPTATFRGRPGEGNIAEDPIIIRKETWSYAIKFSSLFRVSSLSEA